MTEKLKFGLIVFIMLGILFPYSINCKDSMMSKQPSELKPDQHPKIQKAIMLHDEGKYSEAIEIYKELLTENPDVPVIYYEISFSFYANKDYENAAKYSRIGMEYDSELFPMLAVNLGNSLDNLGKAEEAIEIYKEALNHAAYSYILHFNLGVTYSGIEKLKEAKECFYKSAYLNPEHASTQFALSNIYSRQNLYIPTLLASCRFLMLENNKERSKTALNNLNAILNSGISAGENKEGKKTISINVNSNSNDSSNPWSAAELMLKLMISADMDKPFSEFQKKKNALKDFFLFVSNQANVKSNKDDFSYRYYQKFFSDIKKNDYVDAATHLILYQELDDVGRKWYSENQDKINEFKEWMKKFTWPDEID